MLLKLKSHYMSNMIFKKYGTSRASVYILKMYVTANRSKKISSVANIQYFSQNLQRCIFTSQCLSSSQLQPSGSSLHLALSVELKEQTALLPGANQSLIFSMCEEVILTTSTAFMYRRGWKLVFTQQKAFSYRREWMGILGCRIQCLNTEVGSLHQIGLGASLSGLFLPRRLKISAEVLKETARIREWQNENKEGKKKEKRESCTSLSI